ncbi:hypothetical protein DEO72_LG9g1901 [Vigna unguiculata]|uniref:Uncharacterized protein n=1 Tax=Vigna unguiculata TaxID=3917 RepID=A0A4D6N4D5_VIGUN|nr:hypothetical protein DEO72_LG9g1901 [Vigna unguiculata]
MFPTTSLPLHCCSLRRGTVMKIAQRQSGGTRNLLVSSTLKDFTLEWNEDDALTLLVAVVLGVFDVNSRRDLVGSFRLSVVV